MSGSATNFKTWDIVFPKSSCKFTITNRANNYVGIVFPDESIHEEKNRILGMINFEMNVGLSSEDKREILTHGELVVYDVEVSEFEGGYVTEDDLRHYIEFVSTFEGWTSTWPTRKEIVLEVLNEKLRNYGIDQEGDKEEAREDVNVNFHVEKQDKKILDAMISLVDKERFKKLLAVAGSREECKKMPNAKVVDTYLKNWAIAKYDIFLAFGKKLSIQTDMEWDMDKKEMGTLIENLKSKFPKFYPYLEMFSMDEYVNNSLILRSNDDPLKMRFGAFYQDGMKLSKFLSDVTSGFGEWVEDCVELDANRSGRTTNLPLLTDKPTPYGRVIYGGNNEEFVEFNGSSFTCSRGSAGSKVKVRYYTNQFNDELAKIMTYRKVKGELVISIDPYDYLTMSVNQHGWRSCHRITDGEYTGGALSYLCDPTTAVAFKHNKNEYEYDYLGFKFSGNSKSWRQLVHIDSASSNAIFARQYPSDNKTICKNARLLYESTIAKHIGASDRWIVMRNKHDGKFVDAGNGHQYTDIAKGNDHETVKHKFQPMDVSPKFIVGSDVICVGCGEKLSNNSRVRGTVRCRGCVKL